MWFIFNPFYPFLFILIILFVHVDSFWRSSVLKRHINKQFELKLAKVKNMLLFDMHTFVFSLLIPFKEFRIMKLMGIWSDFAFIRFCTSQPSGNHYVVLRLNSKNLIFNGIQVQNNKMVSRGSVGAKMNKYNIWPYRREVHFSEFFERNQQRKAHVSNNSNSIAMQTWVQLFKLSS